MFVWIIGWLGALVRLLVGELVQKPSEFLLLDSMSQVDDRAICPQAYGNANDKHTTACNEEPNNV
jgi:hypothetical protein